MPADSQADAGMCRAGAQRAGLRSGQVTTTYMGKTLELDKVSFIRDSVFYAISIVRGLASGDAARAVDLTLA